MLTQEKLKEVLVYSLESGVFLWRKNHGNQIYRGMRAGCINNTGYNQIKICGKNYLASRLAWLYMTGAWPKDQIDHINHVRNDDRFCNLREVSLTENLKNQSEHINNKSGVTGVTWRERDKAWFAQISANGKNIHLGQTNDFFEAVCLRKSAEVKYGFHINHGRKI